MKLSVSQKIISMAKPRIFISSTFFDLKQVRADLDRFIKEMGYEAIRNETGSIPYGKEEKLEEYCYREIMEVEILIGIIGGRFGSESNHKPYSISQTEIRTALEQNKQVYIFIDKNVYAEYQTYTINKGNSRMKYRFVDNPKVYDFISEIEALPRNNPIQHFETSEDIIVYLREQWGGLFRKLLNFEQHQIQIIGLSAKISELSEISTTLKRYLEELMQGGNLKQTTVVKVIAEETERLDSQKKLIELSSIEYIRHLRTAHKIPYNTLITTLQQSNSFNEFKEEVLLLSFDKGILNCINEKDSFDEINKARAVLGMPYYLPINEPS